MVQSLSAFAGEGEFCWLFCILLLLGLFWCWFWSGFLAPLFSVWARCLFFLFFIFRFVLLAAVACCSFHEALLVPLCFNKVLLLKKKKKTNWVEKISCCHTLSIMMFVESQIETLELALKSLNLI